MRKRVIRDNLLKILLLLSLVAMPGCSALTRVLQTPVPSLTPLPTLVMATLVPPATNTPSEPAACAYVLASKDAPDAAATLSQAYRSANFTNVDVRAAAYGEDCLDTNTNRIARFAAKQTDIYLTVTVENAHDTQSLGNWIARLVPVIDQVPAAQLPGPNPGNIAIQFTDGSGSINLWFPRKTAQELIQKSVSGSALYEALLSAHPQ